MITLPQFVITLKGSDISRTLSATSAQGAWAKFSNLYFGAVKPARKDYTIRQV